MSERRRQEAAADWAAVPRRRASDWLMHKMRLPVAIASVLCSLGQADAAQLPSPPQKGINSRKLGLVIRVEGGGWGNARREAIETVLYAVADEILVRLPKKLSVPIVVSHTDGNPMALYERGPNGEYEVLLHAKDEQWHLYVYEFAHELCHILANYEENIGADPNRYNQWFEEALCETASLFTLRSLAATWEKSPPGPEWSPHAAKLKRFFDLLINEGHRRLPPDSPLALWLKENGDELKNNPYLRQKNEVVANLLLPLFAARPENWDALAYLNLNPVSARRNLRDYLRHWYEHAPAEHKLFIARVLALLRVEDVVPAPPAPASPVLAGADTGTKRPGGK